MVRELLRRFDLQKEYKVKYVEDAVDEIRSNVKVHVSREEQVLNVSVRDTSPQRAQRMCAALVEMLLESGRVGPTVDVKGNEVNLKEFWLQLRETDSGRPLEFRDDGDRIQVWLDGEQWLDYTDETAPITEGGDLWLTTHGSTEILVDGIHVSEAFPR